MISQLFTNISFELKITMGGERVNLINRDVNPQLLLSKGWVGKGAYYSWDTPYLDIIMILHARPSGRVSLG